MGVAMGPLLVTGSGNGFKNFASQYLSGSHAQHSMEYSKPSKHRRRWTNTRPQNHQIRRTINLLWRQRRLLRTKDPTQSRHLRTTSPDAATRPAPSVGSRVLLERSLAVAP